MQIIVVYSYDKGKLLANLGSYEITNLEGVFHFYHFFGGVEAPHLGHRPEYQREDQPGHPQWGQKYFAPILSPSYTYNVSRSADLSSH